MRSWLSKIQEHYPLSIPVLLFALILTIYYPAMLSGIHPVDDPGIIDLYSSSPPLSQILLPGNGYYYRPVLELSFWLDNRLWGMEPRVMHLENILLHWANSLLVFQLARRMFGAAVGSFPPVPLLTALLFALHPVNVEAVSWIAGRTDPLLALFVLSACCFWLRWLEEPRWQDMAAALVLFGAALLTKETALAACAAAFLLALLCPGAATARQRLAAVGIMAVPAVLLVAFALFFRSGTSGLSRFIAVTELRMGQVLLDALTAYGFYVKKLLLPVPLNFAITGVHPGYAMLGVALLSALSWLLLRRRPVGIMFASAALMALPAVLVAVKQIAWTPFAERYLYLPSAFFVLGLSAWVRSDRKELRVPVVVLALIVLVGFACASLQRTLLWGDKLAFIQDAIAKSPGFGSLYNDLGVILLQRNEVDQAADAFATADRLNKRASMRLLIKGNMLGAEYVKGNYSAVRDQFFQIFKEKREAPADFLDLLHKADTRRMATLSGEDKVLLAKDLLETLDLLNQKRYDPFWLYRSGQLSLIIGDDAKAVEFFSRSYRAAPVDAHYRRAAEIYLLKSGSIQ